MCGIREYIKEFYYFKIKKISHSQFNIMIMKKKGMKIGDNCRIFTCITTTEPSLVTIGSNVTISNNVTFCTHDNAIYKHSQYSDIVGSITIGNNCFIGMNSTIMYGVTLEENCIVAAGSVVTKSFHSNCVIGGNPARLITTTQEYLKKNERYGIKFYEIPQNNRAKFFDEHPEKIIHRGFS